MSRLDEVRRLSAELMAGSEPLSEREKGFCDLNSELLQMYSDLEGEMSSRLEDVAMLHSISRSLMAILDVDALLKNIVDSVKDRLLVESCSLLLLDEKQEFLRITAANGSRFDAELVEKTRIRVGEGISGTVAQTGEPMLIKDIEQDSHLKRANRPGYSSNSFLCVPMKVEGQVIGVINVNEKRSGTSFDEYDLLILSILAANASAALANAHLYREVKEKEALISSINQSVPSGLMALSLKEEILLINRTMSKFLRTKSDWVTGKPYRSALDPEIVPILEPIVARGWAAGLTLPETIEFIRPEESPLPLEVTASLLRDDQGTIIGLLLGFRDMSESREIDKLRHLDQMKSNFISIASHELRTPLTALIASISLLKGMIEAQANDTQRSLMGILDRNARRLLKLVNDLLDLSRLESETISLKVRRIKLKTLLGWARESMLSAADAKKIDLGCETPEDLFFMLDEEKFEQVLLNLVSNAIKFTPEKGRIRLKAEMINGCLQVSIADSGIGLAEGDKEKIFDRFYQVEDVKSRSTLGTGLGLPICKKIVELHEGSITVESTLGKGSTFIVTICPRTSFESEFR